MFDLTGVAATLIGLILLSLSSLGVVALCRLKGLVSNILAFGVIAYATIVLLAEILSELGFLGQYGFLISQAIVTSIVLSFGIKQLRSWSAALIAHIQVEIRSTLPLLVSPALILLGASIIVAMLWGGYLISITPPNNYDSFMYHLSRVAHWLHNGTLHHFQTSDLYKTVHQGYNGEISLLWLTALWGTDQLTGFGQWFAAILTMVCIYGSARQLEFPVSASLFAALIWGTFTVVVAQSTSTKNDLIVSFFVTASFYFLLAGLQDVAQKYKVDFILFGLSLGLAIGTKLVAFLVLPGLIIMAGLLILYKPGQYLPKLLYAGGCGLIGLALVGSYNYALNWLQYQSVFGPVEEAEIHGLRHPSMRSFGSNFGRIIYHFSDPSGLPEAVVDYTQQWRPLVGQKIFSLLNIEPNPTDLNWRGSDFSFDDTRQLSVSEAASWYGPLGFMLFLPTLILYLLNVSALEKNMWKWLTGFVSFSFIVAFATFIRWNPYIGRLLMISITLGAPLLAGFYVWSEKYKLLRWVILTVAIVVLSWSVTHNVNKPIFGSETIWTLNYYELRTIDKPYLAAVYQYIDQSLPPKARLGVAGEGVIQRWDYLLFGPNLERDVVNLGPVPNRIDKKIFAQNDLDYLVFDAAEVEAMNSTVPLWLILRSPKEEWYLVKRSEAEIFSASPHGPGVYEKAFGDAYLAYVQIKVMLDQQSEPVRVLTTDPRMPYYDLDERFVFDLPRDLKNLREFTYLIVAPGGSAEDFERVGLSLEEIQSFLSQGRFVKKVYEVNGYVLYQILI